MLTYSKFGTQANTESGTYVGPPGENGVGFLLTPEGNYNIQNLDFDNVNDIQLNTITALSSNIVVSSPMTTGDLNINNNNITNISNSIASNVIVSNAIKLSNVDNNISNNGYLHIQNNDSCGIFIESDADNNNETDIPEIILQRDGGSTLYKIAGNPNNKALQITSGIGVGSELGAGDRTIEFLTTDVAAGSVGNPSFITNPVKRFEITPTSNNSFVNIDVNNNNIDNVNEIQLSEITTSSQATPVTISRDVDMATHDLTCNNLFVKGVEYNVGPDQAINFGNNIDLGDNDITNVKDIVVKSSFKLSNVNTDITAPGCLHIQNNAEACIYIQTDRDNTGSDNNVFNVSRGDGFSYSMSLAASGDTQFVSGNTSDSTSGDFKFYSSRFNYANTLDGHFTGFTGSLLLLNINNTRITANRNIDMNSNDIFDVTNITSDNIITGTLQINNVFQDDTATKLLVLDGSNNVDFRNVSSLPYTLTTGIVNQITSLTTPVRLDNIDNVIIRTVSGSIIPQGKVLLPFSSNLINANSFVQVSCSDYKNGGNGILVVYSYKDISADTRAIVLANAHMTNTITDTFEITISIRN